MKKYINQWMKWYAIWMIVAISISVLIFSFNNKNFTKITIETRNQCRNTLKEANNILDEANSLIEENEQLKYQVNNLKWWNSELESELYSCKSRLLFILKLKD